VKIGHIQNRIIWLLKLIQFLKSKSNAPYKKFSSFKKKKIYIYRNLITLRGVRVFPVSHVFEQKTGHVQPP